MADNKKKGKAEIYGSVYNKIKSDESTKKKKGKYGKWKTEFISRKRGKKEKNLGELAFVLNTQACHLMNSSLRRGNFAPFF